MKLLITGYDENTGLFAYTTQEVVYGSMSRTYSLRPPVVGFIDGDLVKVIGEIAKLGDRSSEAWQKLTAEQRIIATLYADLYQGNVSALIGAGYTQAVHGFELVPPVPERTVELPTAADLDYIEKNARKTFSAPGVFVACWVILDRTYLITDRKGFCVWVNQGDSPAYVADSLKDAHGWIKGDARNNLERLLP